MRLRGQLQDQQKQQETLPGLSNPEVPLDRNEEGVHHVRRANQAKGTSFLRRKSFLTRIQRELIQHNRIKRIQHEIPELSEDELGRLNHIERAFADSTEQTSRKSPPFSFIIGCPNSLTFGEKP